MVHVIGRTADIERHERRPAQSVFDDVHSCWSLERNGEWVESAVHRNEVFLQISASAPGTVLAWEIERLHDAGYVAIGPFWVPASWRSDADSYRKVVKLVAEHVLDSSRFERESQRTYQRKAGAELEPLLALWPHVVAFPTTRSFTPSELILSRAFPVHPLGVVAAPTWADGMIRSPAEFFFHDLDHARFKIREDWSVFGVAIPDAYQDGSTVDPTTDEHRSILPAAVGRIGAEAWRAAPVRAALARVLLDEIETSADRTLAEASERLLFEIVHEKSFPLVPTILLRELSTAAHLEKLRDKHARSFFGSHEPSDDVISRLDDARAWLESLLSQTA